MISMLVGFCLAVCNMKLASRVCMFDCCDWFMGANVWTWHFGMDYSESLASQFGCFVECLPVDTR
jgi:hypothetical protein